MRATAIDFATGYETFRLPECTEVYDSVVVVRRASALADQHAKRRDASACLNRLHTLGLGELRWHRTNECGAKPLPLRHGC